MKKNNKGFMLIEVIVTSTIVMVSMIALYTTFNKIYNNYRIKNTYYNLDAVYITKEIINSMMENNKINEFIDNTFPTRDYGYYGHIIENDSCKEFSPDNCNKLQEYYQIKNVIFSLYDNTSLQKIKEKTHNQTFYDYIDYVIGYYDIKENEEYNYIILTEIEDGDNHYYANLRLR